MGQGQSAFAAPPNTVMLDLYGAYNGCGSRPTFDHVMYDPHFPITLEEFMEFKQRVCGLTSQYREISKAHWIALAVGMVTGFVLQALVKGATFVFIVVIGVFIAFASRNVSHNMRVDGQIHALMQEFNARYAGRVTFTFVTRNTGMCKPKHSRVERVIWLTSNNQGMMMMPGSQPIQMQGAPVMGMGQPVQVQPPQYQMAGAAQPPYAGTQPGTVPAYNAPPYAGSAPPPYSAPAYPAHPAPGPAPGSGSGSAPAPMYPSPPTPSIQSEVFYVKVPAGVNAGDTFQTKTPSGRTVTVEAPTGAREGLEFQVNA